MAFFFSNFGQLDPLLWSSEETTFPEGHMISGDKRSGGLQYFENAVTVCVNSEYFRSMYKIIKFFNPMCVRLFSSERGEPLWTLLLNY